MDYSSQPRHNVLCIDMKSFYASIEAVALGIDPLKAKLVVVGDVNRNGSVVLASSPAMKSLYSIKTGSRLYEVQRIKDEEIIITQARMSYYLSMSKRITEIFETFVPPSAIHTYSVDESWLTLNGTEKLWGTPKETAQKIMKKIYQETGLISTVGIGDNKFLAKFVLDTYGKKEFIAEARYEDVINLFHHLPVKKMWGIGDGITKRLNKLNIFTVGQLSQSNPETLKKEFGVIGQQLYEYSWGIDHSPVFYDENNPPQKAFGFMQDDEVLNQNIKSVGRGVTLLEDYVENDDVLLVVRDLVEEVCEVLRNHHLEGKTVHLSIDYSYKSSIKGFSRQKTFKSNLYTSDVKEIFNLAKDIFFKHHKKGGIVRKVRVSINNLIKEQIELFDDEDKLKRKKVSQAIDILNNKFGKGTIRSASSFNKKSISKTRKDKIGGHFQ